MSLSAHWYTLALENQFNGAPTNWPVDSVKVALVTSGYTPAQDTDEFWSTPQAFETSGTGYTAGGIVLTNTIGSILSPHEVPLMSANVMWTGATISAAFAVVYRNTGTPSTSPLLSWVDLGGTQSVSVGTFALNFDQVNGNLLLQAM